MDLIFFKTRLSVEFSESKNDDFLAEYTLMNANKSIDRLKQNAVKIEFTEGERFLLDVLFDIKTELKKIRKELRLDIDYIDLAYKEYIEAINFTHFRFSNSILKKDCEYYARIEINDTLIALFFTACDEKTAQISKMRREDENLLGLFILDTQRAIINENRSLDAR